MTKNNRWCHLTVRNKWPLTVWTNTLTSDLSSVQSSVYLLLFHTICGRMLAKSVQWTVTAFERISILCFADRIKVNLFRNSLQCNRAVSDNVVLPYYLIVFLNADYEYALHKMITESKTTFSCRTCAILHSATGLHFTRITKACLFTNSRALSSN